MSNSELLYKQEVFEIFGAAIEVHRVLGRGFLEAVYHEALELELAARGIPFESKKRLNLHYKHQRLQKYYEADIVVYNKIIVELKSIERLTRIEDAQLLNYMKATKLRVGLLINFGSHPKLERKRFVL